MDNWSQSCDKLPLYLGTYFVPAYSVEVIVECTCRILRTILLSKSLCPNCFPKNIKMPILYSVISRGTVVLAKYASCAGNFAEVTEQILSKIAPFNDKLTYSHGNYLFHYVCENRIVYFCITDDVSIYLYITFFLFIANKLQIMKKYYLIKLVTTRDVCIIVLYVTPAL